MTPVIAPDIAPVVAPVVVLAEGARSASQRRTWLAAGWVLLVRDPTATAGASSDSRGGRGRPEAPARAAAGVLVGRAAGASPAVAVAIVAAVAPVAPVAAVAAVAAAAGARSATASAPASELRADRRTGMSSDCGGAGLWAWARTWIGAEAHGPGVAYAARAHPAGASALSGDRATTPVGVPARLDAAAIDGAIAAPGLDVAASR